MFGHWNRLAKEWARAASLPEFKNHLYSAFRYVICLWGGTVSNEELGSVIIVCPFQLRISYGCMISLYVAQ